MTRPPFQLPPGLLDSARVVEWVTSRCEVCGHDLLWRPGQERHRCSWCGRHATWPGGAS